MIMEQKTEQMNAKKIRWNISKAMACVYKTLNNSSLKIKKQNSIQLQWKT